MVKNKVFEIDIICPKCRNKEFTLEDDGETVYNCVKCGHRFSLGNLRIDYEE